MFSSERPRPGLLTVSTQLSSSWLAARVVRVKVSCNRQTVCGLFSNKYFLPVLDGVISAPLSTQEFFSLYLTTYFSSSRHTSESSFWTCFLGGNSFTNHNYKIFNNFWKIIFLLFTFYNLSVCVQTAVRTQIGRFAILITKPSCNTNRHFNNASREIQSPCKG